MSISRTIKRLKMTKVPAQQRELVLDAWQNCENFFVGLQMSCDPTSKVVVDKIPQIDEDDGYAGDFTFDQFVTLYDQITQVDADASQARVLLLDAAGVANFDEWNNFYRRILLKKLQDDMPMEVITQVLSELTGLQSVL